jgi:hypothetical protein
MVLILVASRAGGVKGGATLTKDFSQSVVRLADWTAGFNHGAAFGHQHAVNGAEASALNWNGRRAVCASASGERVAGRHAKGGLVLRRPLPVMPALVAGIHALAPK